MNNDLHLVHNGPCASHRSCSQARSDLAEFISVAEKVSAVALGAFSFYTSWQLFVPFFFVGACIGIYSDIKDGKSRDSHPVSSCAHGFLEQLTGVQLPSMLSLVANIAVTVCHIEHHVAVFVPIIGVSLGNWIGKTMSHYGIFSHKKIRLYLRKKAIFNI